MTCHLKESDFKTYHEFRVAVAQKFPGVCEWIICPECGGWIPNRKGIIQRVVTDVFKDGRIPRKAKVTK